MSGQGGFNYKPNVNRAVTKKWKEANQVSYDGDDYGEEDEYGYDEGPAPVSAGNGRHPGWGGQPQMHPSNRSVTDPSPPRSGRPPSFDRGDERRHFSGGGGAYPTAQRNPFPELQYDHDEPQNFRGTPPLHVQTQGQGSYNQSSFNPNSRGQQYPQHPNAPFSARSGSPHRRSESGNRSNPGGDMYQRRQSPVRPDSQASNTSAKYFPPRKSSLSQQQPPPDMPMPLPDVADHPPAATPPAGGVKALPFIRPSDIYKRMEEEREKERRSQDSSRPSLDLNPTRTRDSSTSARSAGSDPKGAAAAPMEDTDSARRVKPPQLDTVVERKSEYGMDNLLKQAGPDHPQDGTVNRHPTNASSVYTDRPDPVSASTDSRNQSPLDEPYSASSRQYPSLGSINAPNLPPPSIPGNGEGGGFGPSSNPGNENLSHQPSAGYRSVVEQAFDQSQGQNPRSPASGHDSLPRSNSASTSGISPIMGKNHEVPHGPSGPPVTERPIPEEPTSAHSRVMSDSTIRQGQSPMLEDSFPAPPVIQSGYRRNQTPPSRDNSPARHPLNVQTEPQTRPSHGVLGSTEDVHQQVQDENARGRSNPSPYPPSTRPGLAGGLMSPQSNHSTTSEEYKEWQDQKKQFNTRFGIQDSNPPTPSVTSPISRGESPSKGNVKDLAGRYEPNSANNSGRNTPTNPATSDYLSARPAQQSRQESFRPQIPGGWQSSAATPRLETPGEDSSIRPPPRLGEQSRFDSTESIPTAKAPKNWQHERDGVSGNAFAAAAAAGTALAGAFSGPAFSRSHNDRNDRNDSPTRSVDSWERSPASSVHAPDNSIMRDFGAAPEENEDFPAATHHLVTHDPVTDDSLPPTPLPKDTPVPTPPPSKMAANTLKNEAVDSPDETSGVDYFPAPLRTSRSIDPNEAPRTNIPNLHRIDESPVHKDNDRLQQEIVKSLTPKSSNFESQSDQYASNQARSASRSTDTTNLNSDHPAFTNKERPPIPSGIADAGGSGSSDAPRRPFLEQRFSWETTPQGSASSASQVVAPPIQTPSKVTSPVSYSPDTIRKTERTSEEVPTTEPMEMSSPKSASTTRPISGEDIVAPPTTLKDTGPSPSLPTTNPGPHTELPFRKILAIGNQQSRIQAFNESRDSYTHSDGLLDQWILSMQTPEHADVFQQNGRIQKSVTDGLKEGPRPSPNRGMPSTGASKLMQDDGKKLMEASKRLGGKAGGAAKGLFAKGKDKWRSVSAGDKGFLASRRKSAGPDLLQSNEPETSKRDSTLLTAPPQIPAQNLESSPIDGDNLFGSERTDQATHPPVTKSTTAELNRSSIISRDSDYDREQAGHDSGLRSRSPPISIQSRPGTSQDVDGKHENASEDHHGAAAGLAAGAAVAAAVNLSHSRHPEDARDDSRAVQDQNKQDGPSATNDEPRAAPFGVADSRHGPSTEQNLAVPQQRPHSVISDVSSASPSPAHSQEVPTTRRSISPAEHGNVHVESIPSYRQGVPPTKDEEAAADRQAAELQGLNERLPAYDAGSGANNTPRQPRIGPGAQIMPVADLSRQRRQENIRAVDRPFSFDGTEYLNQAIHVDEKNQPMYNPTAHPLSPMSQTISNPMSQVSAEEVAFDQGAQGKRTSKSYSRPFGVNPNTDHPALRQPEQTIDRSQMYPTESPLPSARRPQQDFDDVRRPSPPPKVQREPEGAYRIPGPHFQELRAPRRNSAQNNSPVGQQFQQTDNYQDHNGIGPYQPQYQPQPQLQPQQQQQPPHQQQLVMSPLPSRDETPAKKSKFGGLFQTKSRTRLDNEPVSDGRQKGKLMKQNSSRQNSTISHSSSTNERRDVVGQLPQHEKGKRRMSRDIVRSSTPTDQTEGRKKRFSAMGNLFSKGGRAEKSNSPQRASTLPTNAPGRSRANQQMTYSQLDQQGLSQGQRYPEPNHQYHGSPPPAGGYYAPSQQQQQPQQQRQDSYEYPAPRPSDLRIDTNPRSRGSPNHSLPAAAPPHSYASRDISYQSQPYEYRPSTGRNQSPAPASASGPSHNSHVVALHKRSRSPKLGRPASREDARRLAPSPAAGDGHTPVEGLGTFSSKKISPAGGVPRPEHDQEAPFRIDIPGGNLGEEERKRRVRQSTIEKGGMRDSETAHRANTPTSTPQGQTVAERLMGPQLPASGKSRQANQSPDGSRRFVAELPGSKAEGYESDDEVVMSATAYPGNWQDPVFFGDDWKD